VAVGFVSLTPGVTQITRETNYFTIRVGDDPANPGVRKLTLDKLDHSWVRLGDPTYLYYSHEQIQMEVLRAVRAAHPAEQRVLVVGGGGYTFPRAARTLVPTSQIDVVEIDPGVTAVASTHLGLNPDWGIATHNLDGRQFVAEKAPAGHYHLITLDAVNDLSVPSHLLTREFNEQARRTLTPDGVYLLTVIDMLEDGQLWRSAVRTLRETFPHVQVLSAYAEYQPAEQRVYIIYAANAPLDVGKLRAEAARQGVKEPFTHGLPPGEIDRLLGDGLGVVLTDQFAPVDNMMAEVFRRRKER
jgi:spermidine synthase